MAVATIGAWAVGSFDEAVGVMLFYRVGEYFEDRAVDRSRKKQIMDAIDLRPETVNLVKDNGEIEGLFRLRTHRRGDIVLVRPGDRVPLDGEVVEGESRLIPRLSPVSRFRFVSLPATRQPPAVSTPTARSSCASPTFSLRRAWYSILDSVENAAARKPKIDRFITRFSRVYTPGCCCDCPADRHYPEPCYRRVAQVGLHRDDLPCNLLSVRTGAQRTADLLLRHRRRLQARYPVQGRRFSGSTE